MKGVMLRGKKHKAVSEDSSSRTADTAFSFPGLYDLFSSLPSFHSLFLTYYTVSFMSFGRFFVSDGISS